MIDLGDESSSCLAPRFRYASALAACRPPERMKVTKIPVAAIAVVATFDLMNDSQAKFVTFFSPDS